MLVIDLAWYFVTDETLFGIASMVMKLWDKLGF